MRGRVAVPLTIDVAALDYASYMASPDVIRIHSDGRWPVDRFTLFSSFLSSSGAIYTPEAEYPLEAS